MKKILTIALLLISMMASAQEDYSQYMPGIKVGEKAPAFTALDIKGKKHAPLTEFKGKYIVLDFWASWCPPCRAEIPNLKELYKKYGSKTPKGKAITWMSYSLDNVPTKWHEAVATEQMPWLQISNGKKWDDPVTKNLFKLKAIPCFFVIGPDGKIVGIEMESPALKAVLEKL